jgi:hypothetical protein
LFRVRLPRIGRAASFIIPREFPDDGVPDD